MGPFAADPRAGLRLRGSSLSLTQVRARSVPDAAVNIGQQRSVVELGWVARASMTSRHHARRP
jgi:hypothetical protein